MIDYKTYPKIEDYVNFSTNRLSKNAIFIVLGLLISILLLLSIIPYNEVVTANCIITSSNPIIHIKARSSGHLIKSNLEHGDNLLKGEYIGFINGHGNYKSVLELERILLVDSLSIGSLKLLNQRFESQSDLGSELNFRSTNFTKDYSNYITLKNVKSKKLLETELANYIDASRQNSYTKTQELNNSKIADQNSLHVIERFRKLHEKGVISTQDLELKEKEYYQQIQISKSLQSDVIIATSELKKSKLNETRNLSNYSESLSKAEIDLKNSKELLLTEIAIWKNKNILISPKDGKLAYYNFDGNHKNVEIGDTLYSILSLNNTNFIAKLNLPIHNSSKVFLNQHALLKLDNYPASEWGNLRGTVQMKSEILNYSNGIGYLTHIAIDSTITTYGKNIFIAEDMLGTAEIILERTSILQRILYKFKSIWLRE